MKQRIPELPITCPRTGQRFEPAPPSGHHRPFQSGYGKVILSSTVLDYISPCLDVDGKRAQVVIEMIEEAWDAGNMAPFINTLEFERRLALLKAPPPWWRRLFSLMRSSHLA